MKTKQKKLSTFSQVLLWFGAAISIAEIMTGALIAPLGLSMGIVAIVVGHLIGASLLLLAGLIGARSGFSSAESVRISFGKYGSFGFSILNVMQLLGWTAVMILNGGRAFNEITKEIWNYKNESLWCIVIGLFICLWVVMGFKNLTKVNIVVISLLFLFTIALGVIVFEPSGAETIIQNKITFGMAVELNVVMSLSWMPLISDYTRKLEHQIAGTLGSVLSYFFGSVLMFVIGLGAAIYSGTSDICSILISAGLSVIALFIVLFSTVTTTYLDVYSAGVSFANLSDKMDEKKVAVVVCLLGIGIALIVPMSQYENLLYFIGSVFAPLFAILFVDYYLYGRKEMDSRLLFQIKNIMIWILGLLLYRFLMPYSSPIGITLPVMLMISIMCIFLNHLYKIIFDKRKVFHS